MEITNLKDYAEHQCQLGRESDSCLPQLSPQSGRYRRMIHQSRKILTISKSNPRTKIFFRSTAAIIMERKKHIYTAPFYVIHPFSKFNLWIECIMVFLWMYGYLLDPIYLAFYDMDRIETRIAIFTVTVNALMIIHLFLCFLTGYQEVKTKDIILAPKQIAIHYMRTYFAFDVIGNFPFSLLLSLCGVSMDDIFHHLVVSLHLVRIARVNTAFQYLRQITLMLKITDPGHVLTCTIILSLLFIHWLACIVYLFNNLLYYMSGTIQGSSWLRKLGISAAQQVQWYRRYVLCLHTVILNFYCASIGMEISYVFSEHIILSLIMIFGSIYFVYVLVITLQLIRTATTSQSKYEEFLYQLNDYMGAKLLPRDLRHRIILYYEHRYQKKFFREQAILSALSEHLRNEIYLESCKHMINNISLFRELPKHVVGFILASLKQEVYLPNDVIVQANSERKSMYFISYGTVAVYTINGLECYHLTDGMHFGASMLQHDMDESFKYTCIATEMSECYRWDKADFLKCANYYKDLPEVFERIKNKSLQVLKAAEIEVNSLRDTDVLSDLRQKRIIEKGRRRDYMRSNLYGIDKDTYN